MIYSLKNNVWTGCLGEFVCSIYGLQKYLENSNLKDSFDIQSDKVIFQSKFNDFFNEIFDQSVESEQIVIPSISVGGWNASLQKKMLDNSLIDHDFFRLVCSSLILNSKIEDQINDFCTLNNITKNTLGVHLRTTDMNCYANHSDYGIYHYEDFLNLIDENERNYENIFVCSDNHNSILRLKKKYGDRVKHFSGFWRGEHEESDVYSQQQKRLKDTSRCTEPFIECLALSRCGCLINRLSSLSYVAYMFADRDMNTICLGE